MPLNENVAATRLSLNSPLVSLSIGTINRLNVVITGPAKKPTIAMPPITAVRPSASLNSVPDSSGFSFAHCPATPSHLVALCVSLRNPESCLSKTSI
ncbi:hypothetical protein D3C80_1980770 [compost metagenome]